MLRADVPFIQTRVFGTTTHTCVFPDARLVAIRYESGARLPMHAHASPIFLLTVAGSFDEAFACRERTCRARSLIYRPAGELHSQRFLDDGAQCLAIEPNGDWSSESGADGGIDLAGRPALLAMRLYDEFLRAAGETPLVVEETLTLLSHALTGRAHARERSPHWLGIAVELIESRFATSIRLRDIANEVGRHPVHVSRSFRRQFGCDVAEFVRRRRVHEACRRIREGRVPLSTIAAEMGFSDQSHMGRAFIDVMGRSPGSYSRPSMT